MEKVKTTQTVYIIDCTKDQAIKMITFVMDLVDNNQQLSADDNNQELHQEFVNIYSLLESYLHDLRYLCETVTSAPKFRTQVQCTLKHILKITPENYCTFEN